MEADVLSEKERERRNALLRRVWEKEAPGYDKRFAWAERHLLGADNRSWVCSRARGRVLDVATGTGLNLPYFTDATKVVGVDLSPAMIQVARQRATGLKYNVDLLEADAQCLPFEAESFDSAVCTYSLCNIPDLRRALAEMYRVLRPGGGLLLVDHVRSSLMPIYWIQRLIEVFSAQRMGEYMTRRPIEHLKRHNFDICENERFRAGIVERVHAFKRS
jgi:ubiquinone/menaquinone biosynthesis C-methylase UbiE